MAQVDQAVFNRRLAGKHVIYTLVDRQSKIMRAKTAAANPTQLIAPRCSATCEILIARLIAISVLPSSSRVLEMPKDLAFRALHALQQLSTERPKNVGVLRPRKGSDNTIGAKNFRIDLPHLGLATRQIFGWRSQRIVLRA